MTKPTPPDTLLVRRSLFNDAVFSDNHGNTATPVDPYAYRRGFTIQCVSGTSINIPSLEFMEGNKEDLFFLTKGLKTKSEGISDQLLSYFTPVEIGTFEGSSSLQAVCTKQGTKSTSR